MSRVQQPPADSRDADSPPRGAKTHLERDPQRQAVILLAEPAGIVRGSFGLSVFGPLILLVGLTIYIRLAMIDAIDQVGLITAAAMFVLGLLLSFIGVEMGLRRYRIEAGPDGLSLHRRSSMPARQWQWSAGDIESVGVVEAPFNAANRTVYRLRIQPRPGSGRRVHLLTGRDKRELDWISHILQRELRLEGKPKP